MNLSIQLHEAAAPLLEKLKLSPFGQSLTNARVARGGYVNLLSQLLHIHEVLEGELTHETRLRAVYHPDMARCNLVWKDLTALSVKAAAEPTSSTRRLIFAMRHWMLTAPWSLLGVLYALEGWRLGLTNALPALAKGLRTPLEPGRGLDYHLVGRADQAAAWRRLHEALDRLPLTDLQKDETTAAAATTLTGLLDLFANMPAGAYRWPATTAPRMLLLAAVSA